MIDFYYWPTPNGWKISIALEELSLPYQLRPVDILQGDQFKQEFLAISPNNKIPVIVDHDTPDQMPLPIFESGAILIYLAEKTGRLLPPTPRGRLAALQWLMFQVGGLGPMMGQANHFRIYAAEQIEYAIRRYTNEAIRLFGVMDRRLAEARYFAGETYSIADIAMVGWVKQHANMGIALADYGHVDRWYASMQARPGVQRGLALLARDVRMPRTEEDRQILFGAPLPRQGKEDDDETSIQRQMCVWSGSIQRKQ